MKQDRVKRKITTIFVARLFHHIIQCKPRLLRRVQSRWGFQRGEAAALPLVEHGVSNPVFDIT